MAKFEFRDYQIRALDKIHADLHTMLEVLLSATTGAGKTVIVCRLINHYYQTTNRRFLILCHKQELVEQFTETFTHKTDVRLQDIGLCCAGLGERNFRRRITIGTVQTFAKLAKSYGLCDLLVIDECHRIDINAESQYKQTIDTLRGFNSKMRILGITATPYRLGHGYIYGDRCIRKNENLFPELNHKITYAEILQAGYLVPLTGKIAKSSGYDRDIKDVRTTGDYVLDQLGDMMSKTEHISNVKKVIDEYATDARKICVFCCTINHAERVQELLGDEATIVHSQLTPMERFSNMKLWRQGDKRIITSVNILVEGFDYPPLDCLVVARPTLSTGLYIQAVGRVLRISPETGKTQGLLIDLTDNTDRFGTDLDNIKVEVPKELQKVEAAERTLTKECPECGAEAHTSLRQCIECGYIFTVDECVTEATMPKLADVNFGQTAERVIETINIYEVFPGLHTSKTSGKTLLRVRFPTMGGDANMWLCFPEDGYSGFAVEKGKDLWRQITRQSDVDGLYCPRSAQEALEHWEEWFVKPESIQVDVTGKFAEIIGLDYPDLDIDDDDIPF